MQKNNPCLLARQVLANGKSVNHFIVESSSPKPMTTYIAQFKAKHRLIQTEQNSIFIWHQESGEIDTMLLQDKIKREAAIHFYRLIAGENYTIAITDISVTVCKTIPFSG